VLLSVMPRPLWLSGAAQAEWPLVSPRRTVLAVAHWPGWAGMGGEPVDASQRDGRERAALPVEWVPTESGMADDWLRGMLAGSQFAAGELPLPVVLRRIVKTACMLIGARYGSLGLLGADRDLEELSLVGLTPEDVARIGVLPHSQGVFAALIAGNAPVRLADVASDPRSYGFPEHHPPMSTFLGVPVRVRDETIAILYLAEHEDGEFSDKDEDLLAAVATAAGGAIDNARRLADARRAKRWMQASTEITRHLLTGYDAVSRLTRQENDDLPALALAAALGLIDYFVREHDLVEESWLRTAYWIGDNFDALRLPASAFGV